MWFISHTIYYVIFHYKTCPVRTHGYVSMIEILPRASKIDAKRFDCSRHPMVCTLMKTSLLTHSVDNEPVRLAVF